MAKDIREIIKSELVSGLGNYEEFSSKYNSYVKNVNDNLVGGEMPEAHRQMFDDANGGELTDSVKPAKAKAVDSSSMLSYNFFRWIDKYPITIGGIVYDKVLFEVKFVTLRTSKNHPSNMDVVLVSQDNRTALCIESKFLEYLKIEKQELGKSYSDEGKYYQDNDAKRELVEIARSYKSEKGRYNYGIKQNICHIAGISNLAMSEEAKKEFDRQNSCEAFKVLRDVNDFRFMNVIFCPKNIDGCRLYDTYTGHLEELKKQFLSKPQIAKYITEPFVMNYRQLFEELVKAGLDENLKNALERKYIAFHK